MRLTTFSDYSLRVLMYAASVPDRLITIDETARAYGISRAHLMKVVQTLVRNGFLRGMRGRSGGFTLAKPPEEINLGVISKCCRLPNVLNEALRSFIGTLDRYTLADVMLREGDFSFPSVERHPQRGPRMPAEAPTG